MSIYSENYNNYILCHNNKLTVTKTITWYFAITLYVNTNVYILINIPINYIEMDNSICHVFNILRNCNKILLFSKTTQCYPSHSIFLKISITNKLHVK